MKTQALYIYTFILMFMHKRGFVFIVFLVLLASSISFYYSDEEDLNAEVARTVRIEDHEQSDNTIIQKSIGFFSSIFTSTTRAQRIAPTIEAPPPVQQQKKEGGGNPSQAVLAVPVASRITCQAPCAIFFEGTDSKDSQGRSINTHGQLVVDLPSYNWDFGPGTETEIGGRNFKGFTAAHVYETPGTYDATLTVTDSQSNTDTKPVRITVQSFSGSTFYVSSSEPCASDTNTGLSATCQGGAVGPWKTFDKGLTAMNRNSVVPRNGRILFKRGDTITLSNGNLGFDNTRDVYLGAYGVTTAPKPIIRYTGIAMGNVNGQAAMVNFYSCGGTCVQNENIIFSDLEFRGEGKNGIIATFSDKTQKNILFLRIKTDNSGKANPSACNLATDNCFNTVTSQIGSLSNHAFDGFFIFDSVLTNSMQTDIYGYFSRLALVNNQLTVAPNNHIAYFANVNRGVITGNLLAHPKGEWSQGWAFTRTILRLSGTDTNTLGPSRNVIISNNILDGSDPLNPNSINVGGLVLGPNTPGFHDVQNVLVEKNTISRSAEPLLINGGYTNLVIRNNIIDHRAYTSVMQGLDRGLSVGSFSVQPAKYDSHSLNGLRFYNNLIISDIYTSLITIQDSAATNMEIRNNLLYFTGDKSTQGNSAYAIAFETLIPLTTNQLLLSNNIYYNLLLSKPSSSKIFRTTTDLSLSQFKATYPSQEQGSLEQLPLFMNYVNGDYRTLVGSPNIDSGMSLATLVSDDFEGIQRPQGPAFDMGAYEFSTTGGSFNFNMVASPASGSTRPGTQISTNVIATRTSGTAQEITFKATGQPSQVAVSFLPPNNDKCTPNPTCQVQMLMDVTPSTPLNSYPLTITSTAGALVKTTPYTLTVEACSKPTLTSLDPSIIDLKTTYKILTLHGSSFDSNAIVKVNGLPYYKVHTTWDSPIKMHILLPQGSPEGIYLITVENCAGKESLPLPLEVKNSGGQGSGDLVGYWKFDEGTGTTAQDSSTYRNNGNIQGATWITGKTGQALQFDGASNGVIVADSDSLDLTNAITVEAWVNPASVNGWRSILMKDPSAYWMYANRIGGTPSFGVYTTTYKRVDGLTALPLNTWTHVAGTYDGATQKIYINGNLVASAPLTGTIITTTDVLGIGKNNAGEYFQGILDEVKIYNRALSQQEIRNDMYPATSCPIGQPNC